MFLIEKVNLIDKNMESHRLEYNTLPTIILPSTVTLIWHKQQNSSQCPAVCAVNSSFLKHILYVTQLFCIFAVRTVNAQVHQAWNRTRRTRELAWWTV